jgi:2-polyprenyl-6-hydroxyphenyl methylase/3-demethylubiquinone-9 3-methyltransferase
VSRYYAEKLSGERLQRCYEIAPARVRQYLEAEIVHVLGRLRGAGAVLELGCGYGRIAGRLAGVATRVVGIDTAPESIELARRLWRSTDRCEFLPMDAIDLRFANDSFDAVVCLQNGICAFRVDPARLLEEALRVTREGGVVLLSSYSDRFWPHRLAWFEAQAAEGLVGRIDRLASMDGVIVCEDGFRSRRLTPAEFRSLCSTIGVNAQVCEVDGSSVFCEITKPNAAEQRHTADGALRGR